MTFYTDLTNADTVLELFEAVVAGIIVLDTDGRVLMVNRAARELLGKTPNCLSGQITCHDLLYGIDEPCAKCPLQGDGDITKKVHSLAIKKENGKEVLLNVYYSKWINYIVLTMHDVTKEVGLLREVDLGRKELQAKNYIIERRRQEVLGERRKLEQLWDNLPDALLTVDDKFSIERKNNSVNMIFSVGSEKCYELVGNDDICDGCPAVDGFVDIGEKRKSHKIGDKYVTETIIKSPSESGGLLMFRDTTRQIKLIGKIREQQDAITRKNEILSGLVSFSAKMQKSDISAVMEFFLDLFLPVIKCSAAALLVDDIRPGNIWESGQRGITDDEMAGLSRAFLSRAVQNRESGDLDEDAIPWPVSSQVPLVGGDGQRVGLVVFDRQCLDGSDEELIHLFTEPFGAYIHNQLLMRKLEERANTDPLTGLYNRGYLERALAEERSKLASLNIHHAVVVADVNRLKKANDIYGHEAGDKLITTVSDMLKDASRLTDIVARTGGDEFLILLTDTDDESAKNYVKRLNNEIFNEVFMEVGEGEKFPVTVSLGATGTDKFPPDDLVKEADRLMYAAKEAYYATETRYR